MKECGLTIYRLCPIRIAVIYLRGKFVGDFNMDYIFCGNLPLAFARGNIVTQIMLLILKSPTDLPLP
jgi:hypothetical protein